MEMLVKTNWATEIKKVFLTLLCFMLLSGCSTSAQEKRNNYDACLIEMEKQLWEEVGGQSTYISENNYRKRQVEAALKGRCVKFLK